MLPVCLVILTIGRTPVEDDGIQILCADLLQAYHLQHRRLEVTLTTIAQAMNPNSDPITTIVDTVNLPSKCALPRAKGLHRLNLADNKSFD
ncbi:unnamed protein product [Rodentolepis nana]|uniref:Uncharacterized protein n=1 Tax=Rodentolepis nana TaxID=102285 RepID=A0A0R3TVY4_RODNA|nr:unnamed protein product [Rodentolepis nana]